MSGCSPCGPTIAGQPSGGGGMGPPGPPGPPGPSGGCANTVIVEAADPFATLPAPVGSVVTLDPDTLYKFCGNVDVGANILDLPSSSVAAGDDPLVDSVTGTQSTVFRLSEGGTVKDLAIRNAELVGSAILVGGSIAPVQAAVFFNISVNAADQGTLIIGQIAAITFARYLSQNARHAIQIGTPEDRTTVGAISVDQAVLTSTQADFRGIVVDIGTVIGSFAFAQTLVTGVDATAIGVQIRSASVTTIRASSCAYAGLGTPSQIGQPPPLGLATFGSAVQSESVGCVGSQNSLQRGSATIQNALTNFPGPVGTPQPIGQPADSYTLDPSAVRISLVGATAPTQVLRFDRLAPYSGLVAVSLSVQVQAGFTFTPRIVLCGLLKNGVQIGVPFAATTPDFSTAAPVSLAFATPTELVGGDEIQVLISNQTDATPLLVVAARVTIT